MVEYDKLIRPVGTELGGPVESDFTDITRLRQEFVEETEFGFALMGKLRVQAQSRSDPAPRKPAGSLSGARRGGHRQDVKTALCADPGDPTGLGIKVQVTVKIDHVTPSAFRNEPNSFSPRPRTSRYSVASPSKAVLREGPAQAESPSTLAEATAMAEERTSS